jgi:class 3 adenylate cyclase
MIAETYKNVTILFADIVGFTKYSAKKEPRQVIEMLSKLFTDFDKECNRLNLFKVYTIGDCYVVMGFIDKKNRKPPQEEANDVVQLAICMIQIIRKVKKQISFPDLNMRIGIHTVVSYNSGQHFWRSYRNGDREIRYLRA